jgi:hypothetical protein
MELKEFLEVVRLPPTRVGGFMLREEVSMVNG